MTEMLIVCYVVCTFAATLLLSGLLTWGLWAWLVWVFPVEDRETKRTLFGAIFLPVVWVGIVSWLYFIVLE